MEEIINVNNQIIRNSNDLKNYWNHVYACGRVPAPRHAHASALVGDSLYMYGGYGVKGVHLDDFFRFDLKLNKWFRILKNEKKKKSQSITPTSPIDDKINIITARHSHSMVAYGECLYLFGGIGIDSNSNESIVNNDLYEYNTVTDEWKLIVHSNESTFIPEKRWGHSAVVYNDHMVIFGGMGQSVTFYPTILLFNFKSKLWSRVTVRNTMQSQIPRGRQYHTCSIINDKLYILGGYDGAVCPTDMFQFDLTTNLWSVVQCNNNNGNHIIVRCGTSAVVDNKIYLFGGRNKLVSNSLHEFNPSTQMWREIDIHNGPSPRQYSTCFIYSNNFFIFGGQSDYNENDIFYYPLNLQNNNYNNCNDNCNSNNNNNNSIFNQLFENRDTSFPDIKFMVENRIINAHKCVLISRNEKLRALITNGMLESTLDVINISDCSYNCFFAIIQYLYTGNLIFDNLNILELLLISDQYMINEIKNQCLRYISNLSQDEQHSETLHQIIKQFST
ncbi:hypothetical protein RB653_002570 [Dictyostelium firmibasis]|uniref:BTB domain-containing protein n=1 Tax=Dictyostelium firmibasis TaxID=79012 RepID=A0AAN7YVR1_9MYCE